MSESEALTVLTRDVLIDPRLLTLTTLLLLATVFDIRQMRIPNWLCLAGIGLGLMRALEVPVALPHGLWWALQGMLVGLGIMLPLWLCRAIGAGDAKLAAMTGVFLGPATILYACLAAFICAGLLTLIWSVWRGSALRLMNSLRDGLTLTVATMLMHGRPAAPLSQTPGLGRLPFALSFAIGALGWVALQHYGLVA